jgi:hypothetical protein
MYACIYRKKLFHGLWESWHTSGCVWCGERMVVVPAWWQEGFEKRGLDDANTLSLIRPGLESSVRSAQLICRWSLPRESAPWSGTGDGEVLMGRSFWVGCGWFFSWGGGEGDEETPGHGLLSRFFAGRHESPVMQTCALFKCRQPDDHFHTLKTVEGLLHLVLTRTPRSSG